MEVPLFRVVPVSLLCDSDKMLKPGAQMLVQRPELLNRAFTLERSIAPTVNAEDAKAGVWSQASRPKLPDA